MRRTRLLFQIHVPGQNKLIQHFGSKVVFGNQVSAKFLITGLFYPGFQGILHLIPAKPLVVDREAPQKNVWIVSHGVIHACIHMIWCIATSPAYRCMGSLVFNLT